MNSRAAVVASLAIAWRAQGKAETFRAALIARGIITEETALLSATDRARLNQMIDLAKTRKVMAGSIIGSGTVSNRDPDGSPGRPCGEGGRGYSCIAELRMVEAIAGGEAQTPFLRYGDTVRIEMRDRAGHSIFGAIEQRVAPYPPG